MHDASILDGLPQLTGVRLLWFSDWYDGPVTGMAVHDGEEFWYVVVTNPTGPTWDFEPRIYVAHRLAAAQRTAAWADHRAASAAGLPGCLHRPPCPVDADAEVGRDQEGWETREEAYASGPAVGWFRADP